MDILSASNFTSFGFCMSSRKHSTPSYRYGFNGKEKDDEGMGGGGSTYDYGFRIYNPALGRFLSVDLLSHDYPFYSPYLFAGNKPIVALDLDGLEELDYKVYAEKMKTGATLLNKVAFRGHQPHVTDNEYWGPAEGGVGLVMKAAQDPAKAFNHIFEHPEDYKFGCAEYIQVVMLYGKLQAMGDQKFNEYIKAIDNGKFGIDSYGATGNKVDNQWYLNDDGKWIDDKKSYSFKKQSKRKAYRLNGEKSFNPEKHMANMPNGTRVWLDNTKLGNDHAYDGENMLKVGEDLYICQFLGSGLLSMEEAKKELAKQSLMEQMKKLQNFGTMSPEEKDKYISDNLTPEYVKATVSVGLIETFQTTDKK